VSPSQIPNLICVLRIVLVLPIVWALVEEKYGLTLVLFAVAALSDGLDGFLAKNFGWHTEIGALLDPIADKLLLVSVFLALTYLGMIPVWLMVVVVARDIIIVSGALGYQYLIGPVEGRPTAVSKINTGLQLAYVLAVVAYSGYGWPTSGEVLALGSIMFVTTVVSGMDYVWSWGWRAWQVGRTEQG